MSEIVSLRVIRVAMVEVAVVNKIKERVSIKGKELAPVHRRLGSPTLRLRAEWRPEKRKFHSAF